MKNLFKFLLLGAFTLSLGVGFVGCKNYDDDIADLCEQVELLWGSVEDLQSQVDGIVIPPMGSDKYVTKAEVVDGKLVLTFTDNSKVEAELPVAAMEGAYVEKNTEDGSYTLFIDDVDGNPVEVKIPTAASAAADAIKDIRILGTIAGFDAADNISVGTDLNTTASQTVNYAWISKFQLQAETETTATTGGSLSDAAATYTWPGGAVPVTKGMVLNTMKTAGQGIIVEVTPSTADFTKVTGITLVNNASTILPVKLGTPERVTTVLTSRAVSTSTSALYFIPMTYTDAVYTNTATGANGQAPKDYDDLFVADALYWLEWGGVRYGDTNVDVTFTDTPVASPTSEAAVLDIVDADEEAAAGTGAAEATAKALLRGFPYTATFAAASNVADYYFSIVNPTVNVPLFGAVLSNNNQTITLNKIPDPVTAAGFKLGVHKLMIDGIVYYEEIWVKAIHKDISTPYALGDYLIVDEAATGATPWAGAAMKTIDLAQMFADLRAQDYAEGVNLETYWKGTTGATTLQAVVATDVTAKTAAGANDSAAAQALAPQTNMFAAANIAFYKDAALQTVATNLYDARYMVITPNYSPDGSAATMIPNDNYTVVFTFLDAGNNELNKLTVTFTPKIPDVNELIVKNINGKFWSADGGTLLAYYPEPAAWATSDQAAQYNINPDPATGNGGFLSLGGVKGEDQKWADPFDFTINAAQKFGTPETLMTDVAAYYTTTTFGLYYQNQFDVNSAGKVSVATPDDTRAGTPNTLADPYKQPIDAVVDAATSKYLGVYSFNATAPTHAFYIQLMSGLYEGDIKVANGATAINLEAVSGTPAAITSKMITGHKYNLDVTYSVFTSWNATATAAEYKYTYIKEVLFSIPTDYRQNLELVGATTGWENIKEVAAIAADDAATTDINETEGHIGIQAKNQPSGVVNGKITVTVNDRFGKTKSVDLTVNVNVRTN